MPNPRAEPPQWTRSTMIRTGFGVAGLIILSALLCFALLTGSIRERKVMQKAERAMKDFRALSYHLDAYLADTGNIPPLTREETVPDWFTGYMAERMGGAPLHYDEARYHRLDVFSADKPYAQPFYYEVEGMDWLLASRGPDGSLDITSGTLVLEDKEFWAALRSRAYDPTNGALSSGDLFLSSRRSND